MKNDGTSMQIYPHSVRDFPFSISDTYTHTYTHTYMCIYVYHIIYERYVHILYILYIAYIYVCVYIYKILSPPKKQFT